MAARRIECDERTSDRLHVPLVHEGVALAARLNLLTDGTVTSLLLSCTTCEQMLLIAALALACTQTDRTVSVGGVCATSTRLTHTGNMFLRSLLAMFKRVRLRRGRRHGEVRGERGRESQEKSNLPVQSVVCV